MKRSLPADVDGLQWLAEQLGIGLSTTYRQASTGELTRFGVFKVGGQYRVSKIKALRELHGTEPEARTA